MIDTRRDTRIVPIGPGGLAGKTMRIAVLFATAGFVYPNVFLEGIDMIAMHTQHMKNAERSAAAL